MGVCQWTQSRGHRGQHDLDLGEGKGRKTYPRYSAGYREGKFIIIILRGLIYSFNEKEWKLKMVERGRKIVKERRQRAAFRLLEFF